MNGQAALHHRRKVGTLLDLHRSVNIRNLVSALRDPVVDLSNACLRNR